MVAASFYSGQAQTPNFQIASPGSSRVHATPGKPVTVAFQITNNTEKERLVQPELRVPKRWKLIIPSQPFRIASGEQTMQFFTLSVPNQFQGGTYALVHVVRDPSTQRLLGKDSVEVVIPEVTRISLQHLQSPQFVVKGQVYTSTFQLTNEGNVPVKAQLSAQSNSAFPIDLKKTTVHLPVNASTTVRARVTVPEELPQSQLHTVDLNASLTHAPDVEAQATSSVRVASPQEDLAPAYRYAPLQTALYTAYANNKMGSQLEAQGQLPLENHRFTYRLRTPAFNSRSSLYREQYRLTYENDHLQVHLGDSRYALSPLTERSTSGTGAKVNYNGARWTAGTFAHQPRYRSRSTLNLGGYTTYRFGENTRLGLNYLHKEGQRSGSTFSVTGGLAPYQALQMDLEYGISQTAGNLQQGYRTHLSGQSNRFSYSVRYLHTSDQFTGEHRGYNYRQISSSLRILPRFYLEGRHKSSIRSEKLINTRIKHRTNRYQLGLRYKDVSLSYHLFQRQELPALDQREQSLQLQLGHQLGPLTLHGNAKVGQNTHSGANSHIVQRYQLRSGAQLSPTHLLQIYTSYTTDANYYTAAPEPQWSTGFSTYWQFSNQTLLNATLGTTQRWSPSQNTTSGFLNLQLDHTLPFGHQVILNLQQHASGQFTRQLLNQQNLDIKLDYRLPLQIPIGRRQDLGRLEGQIIDTETGQGVANALVVINNRAVTTGANGDFAFSGLAPGEHLLEISPSSLKKEHVIMRPMPASVHIRGGQTQQITLRTVTGTTLTGRVVRYKWNGALPPAKRYNQEPRPAGGVANTTIQLRRNQQKRYLTTNFKGRFTARGLAPGLWQARVIEAPLPDNTYMVRDSFTVELKPQETNSLYLKALPRKPTLPKFQNSGQTLTLKDTSTSTTSSQPETDKPPAFYTATGQEPHLRAVARKVYGDQKLWPKIWLANKKLLSGPDHLVAGQKLHIPPQQPLTSAEQKILDNSSD